MDNINTNLDLGNSGTNSNIDTSNSINDLSSESLNFDGNLNTSTYQTNNINNGYDVEEFDLSEESNDDPGFLGSIGNWFANTASAVGNWVSDTASAVGDWAVDTAVAIYETGADVVNGVSSWVSDRFDDLKGIGANILETAANLASNVASIAGVIGNWVADTFQAAVSTAAVFLTSVTSGVAKLGEHIVDGLAWCGGKVVQGGSWLIGKLVGLFDQKAGDAVTNWGHNANEDVKEFIATDWIGKANELFYEKTGIGQYLNEHSAMKYDSALASKIRNITTKASEIVAATAVTIATGGAAAPVAFGAVFGLGAVEGLGKSAEGTYQNNPNGGVLSELGILGGGALSGLSWVATGRLGKGFVEIGKAASDVGLSTVISKISKDILTKDFWKKALKDGLTGAQGAGNYVASAMMTGDKIIPYITGEKDWSLSAIGDIALTYAACLGLNIAEDALRGYVTGFKAPSTGGDSTTIAKINKTVPPIELKNDDDVAEFANKYLSEKALSDVANEDEYISEATAQLKKYFTERISKDPTGAYYSLMNLTSADMDTTVMSRVITEAVNSSADFRKAVLSTAKMEAFESMGKAMGITDEKVTSELVDCILGKDFVEGGIGAGSNWDRVKEIILPYVKQQVKSSPDGVTLWTKVSNYAVDDAYPASIENVTVGSSANFLETILCNWNGDVEGAPKCERLWGILSEAYAEACSEITDSAGNPLKQLKLIVPKISSDASDYGTLFSKSELPTLLKMGTIDSIDVTSVAGFEDLTETGHKVVDITGIRKLYEEMTKAGASSEIISEVTFSKFLDLVGGK